MNGWRIVRAIALRDLRLLVANKITVISMVVLPLVIFVALPLLVGLVPTTMNVPVDNLDILVDVMPEEEAAELPADPDARLAVLLGYLLAPMFLLVPLMLSVVAAAGSIAGERERRTLETLLLSPATDRQLFLAKTAGAWVPPS
jgi:ABC-2 type transport system permease protein